MEKEVYFFSSGIKLYGIVTIPENLEKDELVPAVVMSHGYGATRNELGDFIYMARKFKEAGIASFRFDNRGCGKSEYPPGKMLCSTEWKEDLISSVYFISSFSGIDPARIGLFGESMGGANVIQAGASERISKCVVALSAISDGFNWIKGNWLRNKSEKEFNEFLEIIHEDNIRKTEYGNSSLIKMTYALSYPQRYLDLIETLKRDTENRDFRYYIEIASIDSVFNLRPIDVVDKISPKPLLIMAGKKDDAVPWQENSKLLFDKAIEKKEFKLFENGDHGLLSEPTKSEATAMILGWFKKYL